jgi:hypothetical protein
MNVITIDGWVGFLGSQKMSKAVASGDIVGAPLVDAGA